MVYSAEVPGVGLLLDMLYLPCYFSLVTFGMVLGHCTRMYLRVWKLQVEWGLFQKVGDKSTSVPKKETA